MSERASFRVSTFASRGRPSATTRPSVHVRERTRGKRTARMENSLSSVSPARAGDVPRFSEARRRRRPSDTGKIPPGKSRDAARRIRSQLTGELLMKPNVRSRDARASLFSSSFSSSFIEPVQGTQSNVIMKPTLTWLIHSSQLSTNILLAHEISYQIISFCHNFFNSWASNVTNTASLPKLCPLKVNQ